MGPEEWREINTRASQRSSSLIAANGWSLRAGKTRQVNNNSLSQLQKTSRLFSGIRATRQRE